jgi:hypothetical protein
MLDGLMGRSHGTIVVKSGPRAIFSGLSRADWGDAVACHGVVGRFEEGGRFGGGDDGVIVGTDGRIGNKRTVTVGALAATWFGIPVSKVTSSAVPRAASSSASAI